MKTSESASRETCQRISGPDRGISTGGVTGWACVGLRHCRSRPSLDTLRNRCVAGGRAGKRGMRIARGFHAGVGRAAGAACAVHGGVACGVPERSPGHAQGRSKRHDNSPVAPDQAESLTGPFGAQANRFPRASVHPRASNTLAELQRRGMAALSRHDRALSARCLSGAGAEDGAQTRVGAIARPGAGIDRLFESPSAAPEGDRRAPPPGRQAPDRLALHFAAFAIDSARFAQTERGRADPDNLLHDPRHSRMARHADFRER